MRVVRVASVVRVVDEPPPVISMSATSATSATVTPSTGSTGPARRRVPVGATIAPARAEALFVPDDPPRRSLLALWHGDGVPAAAHGWAPDAAGAVGSVRVAAP